MRFIIKTMFHFYWSGPLLFGSLQCIFLGGPDPPRPPRESTRLTLSKCGKVTS